MPHRIRLLIAGGDTVRSLRLLGDLTSTRVEDMRRSRSSSDSTLTRCVMLRRCEQESRDAAHPDTIVANSTRAEAGQLHLCLPVAYTGRGELRSPGMALTHNQYAIHSVKMEWALS